VLEQISHHDPAAYTAGIMHLVGIWVMCSVFPAGHLSIAERELELQAQLEELRLGVSYALAGGEALAKWGFAPDVCAAVKWQIAPPEDPDPDHLVLAQMLQRAIAIVDWHYGLQNEKTFLRTEMTVPDLEACNRRAEAKVGRIGFGF
jgi:HD-like signal output (HDOD) protein